MAIPWEQSYEGQLRELVGSRTLIIPGAAAWLRDDQGRVLLIRRKDNDEWGFPAGALEPGESIFECLRREVNEETGLVPISATPMAVYSGRRVQGVSAHGNPYQGLLFVFLVEGWTGSLRTDTTETTNARFFHINHLPGLPARYQERLEDLKSFDGEFIVK